MGRKVCPNTITTTTTTLSTATVHYYSVHYYYHSYYYYYYYCNSEVIHFRLNIEVHFRLEIDVGADVLDPGARAKSDASQLMLGRMCCCLEHVLCLTPLN